MSDLNREGWREAAREYHTERNLNGGAKANGHHHKPSWRDNVMSAPDLCDQKFPELKFLVPGLFPEGVTLIVSRPKLGKSWLLLQIGAAIANGMPVLVSGDYPLQGDVLYLNLEDGDRKAQRRMTKHFGALRENWPDRMTIARSWRGFDQGGVDDLREWCKSVDKPTLINIDTLKRVRPPKKAGQTDYDADYEACQGLLQLAIEFPGLGVLVAHHDRKMDAEDVFDTVSGTLGLIGGVDTIAVLKRKAQGVSLHIEGRDLVDGVEKAIQFDRETCRWQILGEAVDVHRSAERTRVLNALKSAPAGLTVPEIKAAADIRSRGAADKLLQRMAAAGETVRLHRGKYRHPSNPLSEVSESPKATETPYNMGLNAGSDTSDTSDTLSQQSDNAPAIGPDSEAAPAFKVYCRKDEWFWKTVDGRTTNGPFETHDAAHKGAVHWLASLENGEVRLTTACGIPIFERDRLNAPALGPPGDSLDDLDEGFR